MCRARRAEGQAAWRQAVLPFDSRPSYYKSFSPPLRLATQNAWNDLVAGILATYSCGCWACADVSGCIR